MRNKKSLLLFAIIFLWMFNATKIIALQDGKLVFEGTARELTDEKLDYIYKGISNLEEEVQDEA